MSEDSDYTSDINYPLPHQHNSSAHQFRGEPNYPLPRDNSREYSQDYAQYDPYDRDDRDDYERRGDFDHMDSYERRGSSGPEDQEWYGDRVDSIERTESFDQEYCDDSDQYGYAEHSDTEYDDPSLQGDQYNDRDEYEFHSHHSSNQDYDDKPFNYSHEDYDRTITNIDQLPIEKNKRYDPQYDSRFDSPERYPYSRNSLRDSRDQRDMHSYSREPDMVHSPNYIGRSDTDSEPMSYNSRPHPRHPMASVPAVHRQG